MKTHTTNDYTLIIHGTGNIKSTSGMGTPLSVDELLERFIQDLKHHGHVVEVATLTHGDCIVKE